MRRFLWVLLFVLISSGAWANTISTIFLAPNNGGGDNFGFSQQSPGWSVFVSGGTPADYFGIGGYAPGSTLGGGTTVYLDFGTAQINGVSYDLNVGLGSLFMSSITLPTNGASTVTVPVEIDFSASATTADTGQEIDVGGSSQGKITFVMGYPGFYYPGAFTITPTPEPGTVALIGTGLIGIFSVARRRLRIFTRQYPTQVLSSAVLGGAAGNARSSQG